MLGVETVQALVFGVKIFEQFPESQLASGEVEALWQRSSRAAAFARAIPLAEKADPVVSSQTGRAAFLHDIGELILAKEMTREIDEVRKLVSEGIASGDAERQVVGATMAMSAGTWRRSGAFRIRSSKRSRSTRSRAAARAR